ncbi:hypothetical protein TPHA_0F02660 [Tetrapisispora phaffii CBS 4417]|uniref:Uncharacterized protein n=1 Tax=Tetrapisispora phaffii (strain ATCC 24235 / CBS 4417 / NBRC 1672 / NRRL Y-8282 / UCD 70-5) TaxID=1071381 RepID=G8BUG0_TETPH|nr:hypothetical protein TPHA_0F02660 [Tetrapisispora phaffii CBS 4417]CCE63746.1 hypothetical protein TPHA_0F02660 [Tetrapisispora phaffii CBS 4417]
MFKQAYRVSRLTQRRSYVLSGVSNRITFNNFKIHNNVFRRQLSMTKTIYEPQSLRSSLLINNITSNESDKDIGKQTDSDNNQNIQNILQAKNNSTFDEEDETPIDFMNKLPEELISGGNGFKSTLAENELDTLQYHEMLTANGFTSEQSQIIIDLMLEVLNEEFFRKYNSRFLRTVELDNQSHLFHVAETELRYTIQNSRETQLNDQHLQVTKLSRDLDSLQDELRELAINFLEKDSKVDFNNQKIENTSLLKDIKLELANCDNKISTAILGKTRSEIEHLRWYCTRAGLFTVIILVLFAISGISITRKINEQNDKPIEVVLHTVDKEEHEDIADESAPKAENNEEDSQNFEEYFGTKFDESKK